MKQEIKKFKEWVEANKEKKTAVIHDSDPDGLCSGVITALALKRISGKIPLIFHQNPGEITLTKHTINFLRENFVEFVVTVDLSIDQRPESVKETEEFAKILVLDHHKTYTDLNSSRTLMIKSQDLTGEEGSKYPVSKLSFDLFSELTDLQDLDWISSIGLLGDNAYSHWKDFVDRVTEKYGIEKKELQKATQLMDSIEVMDYSKLKDLIQVMLTAKKPVDLMKKDLLTELAEMEKEVGFWLEKFESQKEVFPEKELIYFEIKPAKHSIKSVIINRISEKLKDKTVIVLQDFGVDHVYFSARRQDFKVKVNDLLEKSIEGIPDSMAGGHVPAAAGKIPREFKEQFKKQLIENA